MRGEGKYYDIEGSKGETHNVRLAFDDDGNFMKYESSCPCLFGSTYRWAKGNENKLCDHIKKAYKNYQNEKIYKKQSTN